MRNQDFAYRLQLLARISVLNIAFLKQGLPDRGVRSNISNA